MKKVEKPLQEAINAGQLSLDKVEEYVRHDVKMLHHFVTMCLHEPMVIEAIAKVLHERYVHEEKDITEPVK